MNRAILDTWVKAGYAVYDLGDGAWGWTQNNLPAYERFILSQLLYSKSVEEFEIQRILKYGFDRKGFALLDE